MRSKNLPTLLTVGTLAAAPRVGLGDITDESALLTLARGKQPLSIESHLAALVAETILADDQVEDGDLALTFALVAFLDRTLAVTHPFESARGTSKELFFADKDLMAASGLGITPNTFAREHWALDQLQKARRGYARVSTWAAQTADVMIHRQTLPLAQKTERSAILIGKMRTHAASQ